MNNARIKAAFAACCLALAILSVGCSQTGGGEQASTGETSSQEAGWLDEIDLSEITEKVNGAWDSVGKDVLKDTIDDAINTLLDPDESEKAVFPDAIPKPYNCKTVSCEETKDGGTVTVGAIDTDGCDAYIFMLKFNGYTEDNGVYISENGDVQIKLTHDSETDTMILSYNCQYK